MSTEPLVSVVTPFFNTAGYLDECIRSVLGQTYTNWEYILVDNCSTDGSASIAERHAAHEPRIRLFKETQFVGQVENYNRALNHISPDSTYCKIVQADDWILPDCLAAMVEAAESGTHVGLVSSLTFYENQVGHGGLSLGSGPVYTGQYAARANLLLGKTLFGSPTCVMYLSDIIRSTQSFFSTKSPHYEDAEVCFEILRRYDFAFVYRILTFNRRSNDSTWARLENYGPRLLHELLFLYRFGPYFLTDVELAQRTTETEAAYYGFLARYALLHRPDKEFWTFHAEGLESAGKELSSHRLAKHITRMLLSGVILHPKRLVTTLRRQLSSKAGD